MSIWESAAQSAWSKISDSDSKRWTGAAHRTFANIAREWALSRDEQNRLLGFSRDERSSTIVEASFRNPHTLERVSYILGIYKAINTLLPIREVANAWLRMPSTEAGFEGRSAIEVMTDGSVEGLRMVRSYLASQCL